MVSDNGRLGSYLIGIRVGQYEVVEKIGQGGMGVVYRAWDKKLRRSVALKVLSTEAEIDDTKRRRFLREARVGSAVVHPGIVTVHDFVSHAGRDIIVMEYVPGVSLRSILEQGALPWRKAVEYGLAIASAVGAAHESGIIHRDLKPANILVTPGGWLKVFDFGISSFAPKSELLEGLSTDTLEEAPSSPLSGTLLYMSPEQTLGEGLDHRSDIFSLGIILYEMLCGWRPFQAESSTTYLYQLHYVMPNGVVEIRPEVPRSLSDLIGECLQVDRQSRPASMDDIVSRLSKLQASYADAEPNAEPDAESDADTEESPEAQATSGVRTSPRLRFGLLTFALLLLGSWAILSTVNRDDVDNATGVGSAASGELEAEAQGQTTLEHYRQAWADLRRFDSPGNLASAIEGFERVVASGEMLAAGYAGLARAYWRRYRWQSFDAHWLERATEAAKRAVQLNEDLAEAQISLGLVELENGHLDVAEVALRQALQLDPGNAEGSYAEARLAMIRGDDGAAQEAFRRSLAAGKDDRELHDLWGTLHYRYGRFEEAVESFHRSIERAPDSTVGYRNLAAAYFKLDRLGEAAAELQKALALEPSTDLFANLGTLYFFQGLFAESADAFGKALELPGGSNRHNSWGNFADACRQVPGRQAEAKNAYSRAIQLLDAKVSDGGALTNDERSLRNLYLARRGDHDLALAGLELQRSDDGENPEILFRSAVVRELAGQRDQALDVLSRALRAGYSRSEVQREPDLLALREDLRYHLIFVELEKPEHSVEADVR